MWPSIREHPPVSVAAITGTAAPSFTSLSATNGIGGAHFAAGMGLVGVKDRVEAIGGRMFLDSPLGAGTTLRVDLPLAAPPLASEKPARRADSG